MVAPGLVPLFKTYQEYFSSEETNPFTDNFAAVMAPYALDPANAAAAHEPASDQHSSGAHGRRPGQCSCR